MEDLADGELDAGAVGEIGGAGQGDGAAAATAGGGRGTAGGVVVVAKGLGALRAAEAGAAAAVAVGEDVAALMFARFGFVVVEGIHRRAPSPGYFYCRKS